MSKRRRRFVVLHDLLNHVKEVFLYKMYYWNSCFRELVPHNINHLNPNFFHNSMRAVWSGSIAFGLVTIPIKLYSAVSSKAGHFRLLHSKHPAPIRYKRFCEKCEKEVPWDEIDRGVEVGKNRYVKLSQEEIKKIRPEKTETIDIKEIVDLQQIDPLYFNSHYYVGPADAKQKSYFLFKEVLQSTAKVAIGTFVLKDKEHVCAIEAYRDGMLLTTLNYADEIKDMEEIEELKQAPKISKEEFKLAMELIDKITAKEFTIEKYEDTFAEELKKLLKKKEKGEIIVEKKVTKKKEKDLIEALKESLR